MWDKDKLVDYVCGLKACSREEFFSATRMRNVVEARMLFFYGSELLGEHMADVALFIKRDRTTMFHYQETNEYLRTIDKAYQSVQNFVQESIDVPKFPKKITEILKKHIGSPYKMRIIAKEINEAYAADRIDQASVHVG